MAGSGRRRQRARRGPLGEGVGGDEEKRWMVMQDISEDVWGGVGFAQMLASIESDCGVLKASVKFPPTRPYEQSHDHLAHLSVVKLFCCPSDETCYQQ